MPPCNNYIVSEKARSSRAIGSGSQGWPFLNFCFYDPEIKKIMTVGSKLRSSVKEVMSVKLTTGLRDFCSIFI